ncbi:MAG: FkbM family methyltransferase, partial [Methanobrevibacter sp.]|nr:FkbM family methyltransferase [Methanobrevibacter sp.]
MKLKKYDETFKITKVSALDGIMDIIEYQNEISNEFATFINDLNSNKKVIPWAGANIINYTEDGLNPLIYFEYFNAGYWNDFDFNLKNRTAIDIGSNVGDSSVYFASQGADVYGFEPVKHLYEYSLDLKKANPDLKDKLHFFNMGVSDKRGFINIDSMDSTSGYSENNSYEVEITTLNDMYLKNSLLTSEILGEGFTWFDTGTNDSMMDASNLIRGVQK